MRTAASPGVRTAAALAFALIAAAGTAGAQDYPAKTVRVVVPFPPGGNADEVARLVMPKLGARLNGSFAVENRSGLAGAVGAQIVAKAAADGYTLGILTSTHAIGASLQRKLPYDLRRDFAPVSLLASGSSVLVVHAALKARSVRELIALARARPGKLHYASAGPGTPPHLSGELFNMLAGVKMPHEPFKGIAPALNDVAAGETAVVSFPAIATALPPIESKRVRALAVTGTKRSPSLPDLPTIAEAGVRGFDSTMWYGLVAPDGTPDAVITRLQQEIAQLVYAPEIRDRLSQSALVPIANTADEFGTLIRAETRKWAKLVTAAGIEVE